jgi:hypothetical protein
LDLLFQISGGKTNVGCEAITNLTVDNAVLGVGQSRTVPSLDGRDRSISAEVRHVVELNELIGLWKVEMCCRS